MKLYSLDNVFIKNTDLIPFDFTGILVSGKTREWYLKGMHHKMGDAAIEYGDGTKEYYYYGMKGEPSSKPFTLRWATYKIIMGL